MIHVVVMVRVKEGKAKEFIDMFKSMAITVRQEKGCVEYMAAVDAPGALPDSVDKNVVTILERWASIEDLNNHMTAPHMKTFFKKQNEVVEGNLVMKMLREA
jgi:quinol monooxygenase YgiN